MVDWFCVGPKVVIINATLEMVYEQNFILKLAVVKQHN